MYQTIRQLPIKAAALTLGLLLSGAVFAIDLSVSVQRTLLSSPQLQLYPYHVRQLEAESLQAGLKPNPTVKVELEDAFGTGNNRLLSGYELTLSLGQVLELGDKRNRRVEIVDRKSAQTQSEFELNRLNVVANTMGDFYQVLRLQKLIAWNKMQIASEQAALNIIKRRAKAGVVGQADVMRMQLHLAKSKVMQAGLTAEHGQSLAILAENWAEKPDFEQVEGRLVPLPDLPTVAMLDRALNKMPAYLVSVAQTGVNEARLLLARANSKANVTVSAGIRRTEFNDDVGLVFSLAMPFQVNNRNQGNIASAQTQYQANLAKQDLLLKQFEIALHRIRILMQNNILQLERIETNLQPVATSLLEEVQTGYELGLYNVLQWVDAQDQLFSIQRDVIEAQHAVHLQFLELERLSGNSLATVNAANAALKE